MSSYKGNLFALMGNVDQTEGRGPMVVTCYVEGYDLAVKIISSKEWGREFGVQGYPSDASDVKPVTPVFASEKEFSQFLLSRFAKRHGS